ncbi:MAG: hypothetical protein LBC87_08360 [Fibromonadaceae bacterium]|jgi:hypothetical protein|nr:hypothetical protein [Fibromonadaceae bacterium]
MRLNRVLLLAATINILIFALVSTISCSGDGSKGPEGGNCWVEDSDEGWNVMCGKDGKNRQVGTLKQSDEGTQGAQGPAGSQGAQGSYCQLGSTFSQSKGGYEILCGGVSQGFLDGCDVTSYPRNENQATIVCGLSKPISLCGGTIFDPSKSYCKEDGKVGTGAEIKKCGKDTYNKSIQYCGYASKADAEKKLEKVLPLCGNDIKNPSAADPFTPMYLNKDTLDVVGTFDGITRTEATCKTLGGTWTGGTAPAGTCAVTISNCLAFADGVPNPAPIYDSKGKLTNDGAATNCLYYESKWKDEYCRYFPYFDANDKQRLWAYPSTEYCGGINAAKTSANALNEGSWKRQYCGFKDKNALVKSVQGGIDPAGKFIATAACDDYGTGLLKEKFRMTPEYAVASSGVVVIGPNEKAFDHSYCGVTLQNYIDGKRTTTTLNVQDVCPSNVVGKNRPNEGSWKNEYCGFIVTNGKVSDNKQAYPDLCDDLTLGPKEEAYDADAGFGFCQSNRKGITKYAPASEKCATGKGEKKTYKTTNEKTGTESGWKGEYCGYADAKEDSYSVQTGICDDDKGPNEDGWKYGYCQGYKDEETGLVKTRLVRSDVTCQDNKQLNVNGWEEEYCGYPSADISETTVQKGACDDGKGPNSDSFGGGYCRASKPNEKGVSLTGYVSSGGYCGESGKPNDGEWKNEYCGQDESGELKVYAGACGDGKGPNSDAFGAGYCAGVLDEKETKYVAISEETCDGKPNDGSWKGEWCFKGDSKIAACTGNYLALTDKNSTDPFSVRCIFRNDHVCSANLLRACDKDACAALDGDYVWNDENSECLEPTSPAAKRFIAKKLARK